MRAAGFVLPLILALASACAGGAPGGATSASAPRTARGGANLITPTELAAVAGRTQNAFEVIQNLRPAMLRARAAGGQASTGTIAAVTPHVFLDTTPFGDLSSLRTIGFDQIREIRFISASDATTLWGTGYPSGVIQIVTRK